MADPKGITERIVAKADEQLKASIEADFERAAKWIRTGTYHTVTVAKTDSGVVEVKSWEALDKLKEKAFELSRDRNRQSAIDQFMLKVDALARDVDELRQVAAIED